MTHAVVGHAPGETSLTDVSLTEHREAGPDPPCGWPLDANALHRELHCNADGNRHLNAISDKDAHQDAYAFAYANANIDANAHFDADALPDCVSDALDYANAHQDGNANSDSHEDGDTYASEPAELRDRGGCQR